MSAKANVNLGNIQKTLLLPLWGRAAETKKEHPLLIDNTAAEIIEKLDFDFSAISSNINILTQTAWISRSIITDAVLNEFMQKHPSATVVNIGCGMDTTFDRVDNGSISWYDLDMPDVISLRRNFISETERRVFIASSFLDDDWLNQLTVTDNVIFIACGVFYYFDENDIKSFLIKIADRFPGCELLFDASSPTGIRVANKKVIEAGGMDEKSYLKWGLEDPLLITKWHDSIYIIKNYSFFRGIKGLPFKTKIGGLFSDLLKIMYMLHLEIKK
jgi:O-methyltransferase involved in polyketide biosynthesis